MKLCRYIFLNRSNKYDALEYNYATIMGLKYILLCYTVISLPGSDCNKQTYRMVTTVQAFSCLDSQSIEIRIHLWVLKKPTASRLVQY